MNQKNDSAASSTLSRSTLRGCRRVTREQPPLLRNSTSNPFEEKNFDVPIPVSATEEPTDVQILHVDDDPQVLELTREFLERTDDQFSVIGETSAVEGLNRLQEEEVDCIISDYDMPNTDGLEFLAIVREQYPDLPFILYTAKGSEEVASEAISAGVTEYMQKEASTEQYEILANRVRNAVERYRSQQQFWNALSWYHRLVEQDIAGVFILQDGEFVYVNEQLANILGYMRSELLGEPPHSIASTPSDEEVLSDLMDAVDDRNYTFNRTFTGERADGTEVPVEVHGGSIHYGGEPACVGILWRTADS
ncbi:response regulator [Halovenus sp. WSH3]|uniref:Response regulator n=1 Tax=Halovenus carboxidivorans TaxID=2692199 RepID=A0A6B0TFF6_9EURY|nr:response regulator [Halovenus carboxidivorans]MXR51919.1 response regulator [Halovenus carboxidivorans]